MTWKVFVSGTRRSRERYGCRTYKHRASARRRRRQILRESEWDAGIDRDQKGRKLVWILPWEVNDGAREKAGGKWKVR
jgi:hypothetical protein